MHLRVLFVAMLLVLSACVPANTRPGSAPEALALLDRVVKAHGAEGLSALKSHYLRVRVSDAAAGSALENGMEAAAWLDFSARRARIQYWKDGRTVAVGVNAPAGSFAWLNGTRLPAAYNAGANVSLKNMIFDDITGLRLGTAGRSAVVLGGKVSLQGLEGELLTVETEGVTENYIVGADGRVLGFTRIRDGKRRVSVIEQYTTRAGVLLASQVAYYEDGRLSYRARVVELEPNAALDEGLFRDLRL